MAATAITPPLTMQYKSLFADYEVAAREYCGDGVSNCGADKRLDNSYDQLRRFAQSHLEFSPHFLKIKDPDAVVTWIFNGKVSALQKAIATFKEMSSDEALRYEKTVMNPTRDRLHMFLTQRPDFWGQLPRGLASQVKGESRGGISSCIVM